MIIPFQIFNDVKRLIVSTTLELRNSSGSRRHHAHLHDKCGPNAPKIAAWAPDWTENRRNSFAHFQSLSALLLAASATCNKMHISVGSRAHAAILGAFGPHSAWRWTWWRREAPGMRAFLGNFAFYIPPIVYIFFFLLVVLVVVLLNFIFLILNSRSTTRTTTL